MWTFNDSNGNISRAGELVSTGYAGHGAGVDNPADVEIPDVGPPPPGMYTVGPAYDDPESGPCTMRLTPQPGTETYGRSGFKIHGDLVGHVGEDLASLGCIILAAAIRQQIADSGDTDLEVV